MSIKIQDYGLLRMLPDTSGLIPLSAVQAQAAGVERFMRGVAAVADTAGGALSEMERVKEAGQWAEARDGLYRFERDVMRELEDVAQSDDLQERWRQAIKERLPEYLPGELTQGVRERVALAAESLEKSGSIYLKKLNGLGQVSRARQSWERGVQTAVERGDEELARRRIGEGQGVFVTGAAAPQFPTDARQRIALNRRVPDAPKDPEAVMRQLPDRVPDDEPTRKVATEAGVSYAELRRRYAESIFNGVAQGNVLRDDGLANSEQYGLISSAQLRRYADARDRRAKALWDGVKEPENHELLLNMIRVVDEDCGGSADVDCMIEVATSGLPAEDVAYLAQRRAVMRTVPQELRRVASRRLNHMYRSGAWGPYDEARAIEECLRVQRSLLAAVEKSPADPEAAMEAVFKRENRFQDEGWVRYRDMKNKSKEKKDKE